MTDLLPGDRGGLHRQRFFLPNGPFAANPNAQHQPSNEPKKKKQGSDIFTKLDSIKIWFHSSAHEILLDYFNIISDNKIQLEQSALDFIKELSQHKIKGAEKVLIPIINRDTRLLEHYFEYFEWSKSISGPVELIKLYNLQKKINVKIIQNPENTFFEIRPNSKFVEKRWQQ